MASDDAAQHEDAKLLRDQGLKVLRAMLPDSMPQTGDYQMRDGGLADEVLEMGLVSVWGQMWSREGLSRRDRSLITMALLIAKDYHTELQSHVRMGITNGVTREEIEELIYHSAGYIGFPAAVAARVAARTALGEAAWPGNPDNSEKKD